MSKKKTKQNKKVNSYSSKALFKKRKKKKGERNKGGRKERTKERKKADELNIETSWECIEFGISRDQLYFGLIIFTVRYGIHAFTFKHSN